MVVTEKFRELSMTIRPDISGHLSGRKRDNEPLQHAGFELKEQNPGKYARDIAGLMNISEAELAFARVTHDAWRMRGEYS